jgi:UDPglucose 6-dehydrogenase
MVALSIESRGHEVKGFDLNGGQIAGYLQERRIPFKEEHSDKLLANTKMEMVGLGELVDWADILFLAPQTPHAPEYEGSTRIPDERVDFDYSHLKECVRMVSSHLYKSKTCVIISTVLPGTLDREILSALNPCFDLVYEPLFIAMGTVCDDFLDPEFVLVGVQDTTGGRKAAAELEAFYQTIHSRPIFKTDIRTAEGIKVFYNTFITMKTVLGNMYGEMAHRLGMNVDDIFRAVSLSTDRLISTKYLEAGMGDGGGCHPRDNIALSYIARKTGLSFDLFDALMRARENHCAWQASLVQDEVARSIIVGGEQLPVFILGESFKPETNIRVGSPAILLSNILKERGIPHAIGDDLVPDRRAIYFIGTKHDRYKDYIFPAGSVVIDPFRYLPVQYGSRYVQIGKPEVKPQETLMTQLVDNYASRLA